MLASSLFLVAGYSARSFIKIWKSRINVARFQAGALVVGALALALLLVSNAYSYMWRDLDHDNPSSFVGTWTGVVEFVAHSICGPLSLAAITLLCFPRMARSNVMSPAEQVAGHWGATCSTSPFQPPEPEFEDHHNRVRSILRRVAGALRTLQENFRGRGLDSLGGAVTELLNSLPQERENMGAIPQERGNMEAAQERENMCQQIVALKKEARRIVFRPRVCASASDQVGFFAFPRLFC